MHLRLVFNGSAVPLTSIDLLPVCKYVEGLDSDTAQLLDLLSVAGGDDIEPTRAQTVSRQALYPDVSLLFNNLLLHL